jgi:hypothetical protein
MSRGERSALPDAEGTAPLGPPSGHLPGDNPCGGIGSRRTSRSGQWSSCRSEQSRTRHSGQTVAGGNLNGPEGERSRDRAQDPVTSLGPLVSYTRWRLPHPPTTRRANGVDVTAQLPASNGFADVRTGDDDGVWVPGPVAREVGSVLLTTMRRYARVNGVTFSDSAWPSG